MCCFSLNKKVTMCTLDIGTPKHFLFAHDLCPVLLRVDPHSQLLLLLLLTT